MAQGLGDRHNPAVVGVVEVDEAMHPAAGEEALIGVGRIAPLHRRGQQGGKVSAAVLEQRAGDPTRQGRSEEHTSELQSLMRISYAVFCLKKKTPISKYANTQHMNRGTQTREIIVDNK